MGLVDFISHGGAVAVPLKSLRFMTLSTTATVMSMPVAYHHHRAPGMFASPFGKNKI